MNKMKFIAGLFIFLCLQNTSYASRANLEKQFLDNEAIIYTINIRSFGAVDKNNDGIIDLSKGDIRGTFVNAKDKLPQLKKEGINTIYLLPITRTGKLKALGNAGSLYALDSFNELNLQMDDITDTRNIKQQAKDFIDYAHELDLNVIVDLPSCGSYDLSLNKPDWFLKNEEGEDIVPADWTDVRLFKIYNNNEELNQTILNNFKSFVDMAQELGFDGIRADVAAIKPKEFWKEIIDYSKIKNKNFVFIAEASPDWTNPAQEAVKIYTSVPELLNAGFIGYYGSWSDFKNIKTKKEFDYKIEKNLKIIKQNKNAALLGAFATHDQQSPILKGINYWNMILWLNATLPLNSYFLDGFSVGDDYIYPYENKHVNVTYTDDELYFVHSGMFDIFNMSASPAIKHPELKKDYIKAIKFKNDNKSTIKPNNFKILKTNNENVFSYKLSDSNKTIVAIGSLNDKKRSVVKIKLKELQGKTLKTVNSKITPKTEKNKITTSLEPLELQVFVIEN